MRMKIRSVDASRRAIGRVAVICIVVLILAAGIVAVYYATTTTGRQTTNSAGSTSTSSSSASTLLTSASSTGTEASGSPTSSSSGITNETTASLAGTLGPRNSSVVVDESNSIVPDSLDPGNGFFEQDRSYLNAVFQDLVSFNGSNSTQIVPVEASSWTTGNDSQRYVFQIRPGVTFSNGDPVTAYTLWFTYVREIYMAAPSGIAPSNFNGVTMNETTDWFTKTCNNFEPWGLVNAVSSVQGTPLTAADCKTLSNSVNGMLSGFNPADATQQKLMAYAHQAYVAPNSSIFIINTIHPYGLLLQDISGYSGSHTVDPKFVDAHGGVQNNTQNSYMNTNCVVGTGPYMCKSVGASLSELVLVKNPDYWAAGSGGPDGLKADLPTIIRPAQIPVIDIKYGVTGTPLYEDFGTNNAALSHAGFSEWTQMWDAYNYKSMYSFKQVVHDGGPSIFLFYVALNSQRFPTNNTDFRLAATYATNYTALDETEITYNGTQYGQNILGPAIPTYGDLYNPGNLTVPEQNLTKAATYLKLAGEQEHFYVTLPNGTEIGDTGGSALQPLEFVYIAPLTPSDTVELTIFQQSLGDIGIPLAIVGETSAVYNQQAQNPATAPQGISLGWGVDYPDVWLQQYFCFFTPACSLPTYIDNSTLTNLILTAAYTPSPSAQLQADEELYKIAADEAWYIWLPWSHSIFWIQPYVGGFTNNPYIGYFYNLMYYRKT